MIDEEEEDQRAVLSVFHPMLGTELSIAAVTIRIGPEQYLSLVDNLANMAFLAPHLAERIRILAIDLKIPELENYVNWMREADRDGNWKRGCLGKTA